MECQPFKDAGLKQGGFGPLAEEFYIYRIPKRGFHAFVYTLSGSGLITLDDGTELRMKEGDCFISWANGQGHFERPDKGTPWEMLWFTVWDNHPYFYPSSEDYDVLHFTRANELRDLAKAIKKEEKENDSQSETALSHYENLFLINVKRSLNWVNQGYHTKARMLLNDLWSAVTKELNKPWSVDDLCQKAGLSKTHLNRICQENYGESPAQKVKRMKMQEAKFLLLNSDESIGGIAYSTGYSSLAIFSHAFKDYYGISPQDFRKTKVMSDK